MEALKCRHRGSAEAIFRFICVQNSLDKQPGLASCLIVRYSSTRYLDTDLGAMSFLSSDRTTSDDVVVGEPSAKIIAHVRSSQLVIDIYNRCVDPGCWQ